jgi:hypothetical protein
MISDNNNPAPPDSGKILSFKLPVQEEEPDPQPVHVPILALAWRLERRLRERSARLRELQARLLAPIESANTDNRYANSVNRELQEPPIGVDPRGEDSVESGSSQQLAQRSSPESHNHSACRTFRGLGCVPNRTA